MLQIQTASQRCRKKSDDEEEQDLKSRSIHAHSEASNEPLPRLSDYPEDYWDTRVFPEAEGMTFELITVMHERLTATWKASPLHQLCFNAIEETILRQEKLTVNDCVCSAISSLTESKDELLESPLGLLVVFEWLVAQLSKHCPRLVVV